MSNEQTANFRTLRSVDSGLHKKQVWRGMFSIFQAPPNMPVITELVEAEQPEHLRAYFKERLAHHRVQKDRLGRLPPEEPGK